MAYRQQSAVPLSIFITFYDVRGRAPFREKVDVAVRLFDALKFEAQYLRLIVQEATNSLAVAYMVLCISSVKLIAILCFDFCSDGHLL